MPIRTKYEIYCTRKKAPIHTGYDKTMAYVEFEEYIRNPKGDSYRMVQTPEAVGSLSKSEEYLLLVYDVRKLIRKYFKDGRKKEDFDASIAQETKLDNWNKRNEAIISSHPEYVPKNPKSHAFYLLVSEWRKTWKERMSYRKRKMGFDQTVLDEMTKKCRKIEEQIDKYIKEELQLL